MSSRGVRQFLWVLALGGVVGCSSDHHGPSMPGKRQSVTDEDGGDGDPVGDTDPGDVPAGWVCNPNYYGDTTCDCGCGAIDKDCASVGSDGCAEEGCYVDGCQYCYDASTGDSMNCEVGGWTCVAGYYGDGSCDCGCGILDTDCGPDTGCTEAGCNANGCEYCYDGSTTDVCGSDTEVPAEWTCSPSYYGGNDGCDCGCGVVDADCATGGCGAPSCRDPECNYCSDGSGSVGICN
jgi:hypothetical protein